MRIRADLPIPPASAARRRPGTIAAAVRALRVGESFHTGPRARFAAAAYARRAGVRLAQRREGDGFRVWRIA